MHPDLGRIALAFVLAEPIVSSLVEKNAPTVGVDQVAAGVRPRLIGKKSRPAARRRLKLQGLRGKHGIKVELAGLGSITPSHPVITRQEVGKIHTKPLTAIALVLARPHLRFCRDATE